MRDTLLALHVAQLKHEVDLAQDLDAVVVPAGEVLHELDGNWLATDAACCLHDHPVAPSAEDRLDFIDLAYLLPVPLLQAQASNTLVHLVVAEVWLIANGLGASLSR